MLPTLSSAAADDEGGAPESVPDRSAQRSAGTSNCAFSAGVLRVVGRSTVPKGISKVALSLRALSGKATLSRMCFSCQSACMLTSTRGEAAFSVMSCTKLELPLVRDANYGAQGRTLDQLHFIGLHQVGVVFNEVGVHVPRVPLLGLVHKSLQQVAAGLAVRQVGRSAHARHRRSQRLGVAALVEEACDASGLGIDLYAKEFILE